MNAIHRYYELGENIKYVSEDIGYSRTSIYQWQKSYLKEGTLGLMNHKNITPGTLVEGSVSSTDISSDEINQLKAQMQDMQLEIDILKETINVLKKDPDIDQSTLTNGEKTVIIDVLKNRYSLLLLQKLQLSKMIIIIKNKKKINIHFYVLESLNYLQRIKVDMVTDEFTPYLSVKI